MALRPLLLLMLLAAPFAAWASSMPVRPLPLALASGMLVLLFGWHHYRTCNNNERLSQLLKSLEDQNTLFQQVIQSSPIGILIQDPQRRILHYNMALCHILELSPKQLLDTDLKLQELIDDDSQRETFSYHYRILLSQPHHLHDWEIPIRTPTGRRRWVSVSGQTLLQQEEIIGIVWMVRDVTFEHRARVKLEKLTRTDPLTGLLNRRAFMEAWRQHTATARRYGQPLTLVVLDLDHFKRINDRWGHHTGDLVLRWFSEQLRQTLREADVIARFGGEEFVVLMPHTSRRAACEAMRKLQQRLTEIPLPDEELNVTITFSAGVTEWRRGEPFEFTYHRADMLLYRAKNAGRNRFYSDEMPPDEQPSDAAGLL